MFGTRWARPPCEGSGLLGRAGPLSSCGSVVEIVALVEIVDEPGLGGLPPQQPAGQCAGRRAVDPDEGRQKPEVLASIRGGDGSHREVEMPCDHLGNLEMCIRDR